MSWQLGRWIGYLLDCTIIFGALIWMAEKLKTMNAKRRWRCGPERERTIRGGRRGRHNQEFGKRRVNIFWMEVFCVESICLPQSFSSIGINCTFRNVPFAATFKNKLMQETICQNIVREHARRSLVALHDGAAAMEGGRP